MIKRIAVVLALMLMAACAKTVSYDLAPAYNRYNPQSVAVLPVGGIDVERDVAAMFRRIVNAKLAERNFNVMPLKAVDAALVSKVAAGGAKLTPEEAADVLGVDAVVYVKITGWEVKRLVRYLAMTLSADFSLYSKDGTRLWRAEHDTRESDIRFDQSQLELAVVHAYEPRVQRILDEVFYTLPSIEVRKEKKEYFKWLE